MNKLNELLKKQDFKSIISLYENSKKIEEMFTYALALGIENFIDKADIYFIENYDVLITQPTRLIESHISIFLYKEMFDRAEETLKFYEDKPYISQEVEEVFISLKKEIKLRRENSLKNRYGISIQELVEQLNSDDDIKVQKAIIQTRDYRVDMFARELSNILLNKKLKPSTRTLALMMLCVQKYNKDINFYYFLDEEYKNVNPSKIELKNYAQLANRYEDKLNKIKNISLQETFVSYLKTFDMMFFPFDNPFEDEEIYYAILKYCLEIYQIDDNDLKQEIIGKNISESRIKEIIELLTKSVSIF